MNTRLLAALALLVTQGPVLSQEGATPGDLVVIDLRPREEKEGFGLAALDGKCNEDVFRIPDVASDPLKVEVLKQDLSPLLGPSGKTLTVLNWSIYYNKQVQKKGSKFNVTGIQGYEVPTEKKKKEPGSKCSQKESAGGWYEGKEATTVYFPLISEFEGTFGGKPLKVRVVYSPQRKLTGKFEGAAEDSQAVLDTVHMTAEALSAAVGP